MTISSEVKIISGLEIFSGLIYLIYFSVFYSPILLIMSIISFIIAFGLLRLYKWAWFLCLLISLFGVISGILITIIEWYYIAISAFPKIIIDIMVILMLLSKDVRKEFKI
jgi:hypothetical protein